MAMSSFNGGREVCMLEGSSMVFQRVKHAVELRDVWIHMGTYRRNWENGIPRWVLTHCMSKTKHEGKETCITYQGVTKGA